MRAEGVGTSGDHEQDHRRAGVKDPLDQLALDAWQAEVDRVTALPGRPASEEPGKVADRDDGDVAVLGREDRCLDAAAVCVEDADPLDHLQVRLADSNPQSGGQRRHVDAQAVTLVAGKDVVGERVAAEEGPRVVAAGADQCHPGVRR